MSHKASFGSWAAVAVATLAASLAVATPAFARDDHDGRQRWGQTRNFEQRHERPRHFDQHYHNNYWRHSHRTWHPHDWHVGHWHRGWVDGRHGWWWVVGGIYYGYPAPIYPYPVDHQASIIINLPPLILH